MPITAELKNVKKFGSVGFTHEQSETLNSNIDNDLNALNIKLDRILNVTDNIDIHIKA